MKKIDKIIDISHNPTNYDILNFMFPNMTTRPLGNGAAMLIKFDKGADEIYLQFSWLNAPYKGENI